MFTVYPSSRWAPSATLLIHSFVALTLLFEPNKALNRGESTTSLPLLPNLSSTSPSPAQTPAASSIQIGQQQQQQHLNDHKPIINKPQLEPPRRQQQVNDDEYLIGVGIADITGPAADINLMGYAKPNQDAGGIHLRQFSRSIVIEDSQGRRVLYTSIDNGMVSQLLRVQLLKRLEQTYGQQMYNESNVMISATHSHSCPGGFFQYMLYNIPSAGYIGQTLEALVDGILRSIKRANDNLTPGRIYYGEDDLLEASINRSPTAYQNNPSDERASYRYDTDKTMHLLKMVDRQEQPLAVLNWFSVHGTSMNSSNHLISSDNKGYAAILLEQDFNPPGTLPGKGKFVAIFAQANEGDVSPNTMGPRCVDTGLPCDHATSTCGNPPRNEKCVASGPGKDIFESTKIIAYKQYYKARQLFVDQSSLQPIRGPVRFVHEHIDMTNQLVPLYRSASNLAQINAAAAANQRTSGGRLLSSNARTDKHHLSKVASPIIPINATYRTCPAALGYSFAAGTTDGPGAFDFQQGDTVSGRYWNMVRDFLRRPSEEQSRCHHPKPILLSTGEMDFPYMWHPKVVPTQILMIGQLAIVGLPGEFTTMAGRRVRNAVYKILHEGATRGTSTTGGPALFDDEPTDPGEDEEEDEAGIGTGIGNGNGKPYVNDDDLLSAPSATRLANSRQQVLRRPKRAYSLANEIKVVLSGLSNVYTSYITTIEEFELQRYEGASTLYGPHTLQAYINQFSKLAAELVGESSLHPSKLQPPDLTKSLFTMKVGVIFDGGQHGRPFGGVINDANSSRIYSCRETVTVSFVAGNPRNDLRQEDSFLYVDRYAGNGTWLPVATDASWETKFIWERTNTIMGESRAIIVWDIPDNCASGVYKIRHYGAHKSILQTVSQYWGQSTPFRVAANPLDLDETKQLDELLVSALDSAAQEALQMGANVKRKASDQKDTADHRPSFYASSLNMLSSLFG